MIMMVMAINNIGAADDFKDDYDDDHNDRFDSNDDYDN